jgi:hypothetical protein
LAKNIVFDSGFWFALYDPTDQNHDYAEYYSDYLSIHTILIPWPSLYETLNTRFMRRKERLLSFTTLLRHDNVKLISDEPYRYSCYQSIILNLSHIRTISLVDRVVREILSDPSIKAHCLVTFDPNDFRDVCHKKGIEILCQQ